MNHFLDTNLSGILIPNRDAANVTNSAGSIMAQASLCSGLYQRNANFILVGTLSHCECRAGAGAGAGARADFVLVAGLDQHRRCHGHGGHDEWGAFCTELDTNRIFHRRGGGDEQYSH